MVLVGIGAVTAGARVGHWDEDAMRRSFRTRPILCAESQGFTLGWYAVPRWGTGMNPGAQEVVSRVQRRVFSLEKNNCR